MCGRTILPGESPRAYLTPFGERRWVCDLCRIRAEAEGWVRVELAEGALPPQQHQGRGRGRVRRLLERARESAAAITAREQGSEPEQELPPPKPEAPAAAPQQRAQRRTPVSPRPRRAAASAPAPAAAGEERPRRRRSIPQNPERRIRRAFQYFNDSDYRRTVAGLIRSLGVPRVCAVTNAASPAEVRITVAWELSWYQWEVDLADPQVPVRELAKGDEVQQLPEDDRNWNALATVDGELRLGTEGEAGG